MAFIPFEVDVRIPCNLCKKEITIKNVPFSGLIARYVHFDLIQNCFPTMSVGQRELFVSGTCNKCYKKMSNFNEN